MANGFTVQPANFGAGLSALAGSVGDFRADQEKQQQAQKQAEYAERAKQAMAEAFQSNDPVAIRNAVIQFPEIGETAKQMFGFTNDQTEQIARQTYRQALSETDPQRRAQIMQQGIEQVSRFGGQPTMMTADLQTLQENPEAFDRSARAGYAALASDQEYEAMFGRGQRDTPAGTREFEALVEASKSDDPVVRQAARIDLGLEPRAGTLSADQRTALDEFLKDKVVEFEGDKSEEKEGRKLEAQLELQPQVAAAVDKAKADVAAAANIAKEERDNAKTLKMYDTAMSGLASALGETITAPGIGWIPAMTSNAQIAEGAQAIMAPILKTMFRTAGEGTFTDKDQEMLMNMIPTRSDLPKARQAKLQAIDAVVRAKLGVEPNDGGDSGDGGDGQSEMSEEEVQRNDSIDDLINKYAPEG